MSDLRNKIDENNVAALVEALLGRRLSPQESRSPPQETSEDYDNFSDLGVGDLSMSHSGPRPDSPPKDICVGVANPFAVAEALLGRRVDRHTIGGAEVLQNVLQTDYDEMFDMKNRSVLYAGLKLNENEKRAERYKKEDMKIITERDLITPDLSMVRRLEDLQQVGLKDLKDTKVKVARMQNGKLRMILEAHDIGKRVTNREITMSINELITPFRRNGQQWMPPNASWRDITEQMYVRCNQRLMQNMKGFRISQHRETMRSFDDPIQGASSNSWFVAALFSVFWADPSIINRATHMLHHSNGRKNFCVRFHDKGGHQNSKTETVEVNYELLINNSDGEPLYCRSSDGTDIWPGLYEKAFAKWICGNKGEHPDLTQMYAGDPVKAMAQINGREPHYFECKKHCAQSLVGLVRAHCLNNKTINPMTAFTYATGSHFHGANVVANHAYSVLGYCVVGQKQYIVLRNPWGITEAEGINGYRGLLSSMEPEIWNPAVLLDRGGVFALDAECFKDCFQYIGIAK